MPFFIGSRGRIHHEAWLPDGGDVERVVVLLHGYGEHLGLYDALARRLVADGGAVHALDAVGHGRSDGERAVLDWDVYADDARQLANLVHDRYPGRPVVLVGHSAGGLAAYLLALRSPGIADALVLSGAPLLRQEWVEAELADPQDEEVSFADPSEFLSTQPEYVHALLHDPLTWHGGFRPETLQALIRVWPEAAAGLAQGLPELPVLFVHGEDDQVVQVADARSGAALLPQARIVTFAGDLHDVLNEHDRDVVHESVAAFVKASTGPVAAPLQGRVPV
jgi:alpha-beta hydrolase superfamily lysophospholipase